MVTLFAPFACVHAACVCVCVYVCLPTVFHKKTAEAVLNEGNVEPYLPHEWSEQEAEVLAHLVGMYGPTNWGIIAAGVATKSETQVRKWREDDDHALPCRAVPCPARVWIGGRGTMGAVQEGGIVRR